MHPCQPSLSSLGRLMRFRLYLTISLLALLILLNAMTIGTRVVVQWVKDKPIVIRQLIQNNLGIDIRYKRAVLNTQFNHWVLSFDHIKVVTEQATIWVDHLALDLSLFPNIFKTGLSSIVFKDVDVSYRPSPAKTDESKPFSWNMSSFPNELRLLHFISDWQLISVNALTFVNETENHKINIDQLAYTREPKPNITIHLQAQSPELEMTKVWFNAHLQQNDQWTFSMVIPEIVYEDNILAKHIGLEGLWLENQEAVDLNVFGDWNLTDQNFKSIHSELRLNASGEHSIKYIHIGDFQLQQPIMIQQSDDFLKIKVDALDLEPISKMFKGTDLNSLQLAGRMESFDLAINLGSFEVETMLLDVKGLAVNADLESFKHVGPLDIQYDYGEKVGRFELNSEMLRWLIPDLYSETKQLNNLTIEGVTKGSLFDPSTLVFEKASAQSLENTHVAVDLSVEQPLSTPILDVVIKADSLSVRESKAWLPDGTMNKDAYRWIQNNFISGHIKKFKLGLKGTPQSINEADHPDHYNLIELDLDSVTLTPQPDWKLILVHQGQLKYFKNLLSVEAQSGETGGINISTTSISIDTTAKTDRLTIKTALVSDAEKVDHYFKTSQLAEFVGIETLIENSTLSQGTVSANVNLDIRLDDADLIPTQAFGSVHFDQTLFVLYNEKFNQFTGFIHFSPERVFSDNLEAFWFEQPIKATLTHKQIEAEKWLVVDLEGVLKPSVWLPNITGKSPFIGQFRLPPEDSDHLSRFSVHSDLVGITSTMPLPLNKAIKDRMRLEIEAQQTTKSLTIEVALGTKLGAAYFTKPNGQQTFESGQIWLGKPYPEMPSEKDALGVAIRLPVVSANRWTLFINNWIDYKPEGEGNLTQDSLFPKPKYIYIEADKFRYDDLVYDQISAVAQMSSNQWGVDFQAKGIKGAFDYDPDQKSVNASFEKFFTVRSAPNLTELCHSFASPLWRKATVKIDEFTFGQQNIGQFTATATQTSQTVSVESFNVNGPDMNITGQAQHDFMAQANTLTYTLDSHKLATMNQLLAIENDNYVAQEVRSNGAINWQGQLSCPHFKDLVGVLNLDSKAGSVKNADPGFGRLIGLLNLSVLERRFDFDLKDVTDAGMLFDDSFVELELNHGAINVKKLQMRTPAAEINITGQSDAINDKHDLRALVTPKYTNTLVPITALVGGLPVGVGVYLANELFNLAEGDDLLTEVYRIEGDWESPKIYKE